MGCHASSAVRVFLTSVALVTIGTSLASPVRGQVRFDDCQPVAGGGIIATQFLMATPAPT